MNEQYGGHKCPYVTVDGQKVKLVKFKSCYNEIDITDLLQGVNRVEFKSGDCYELLGWIPEDHAITGIKDGEHVLCYGVMNLKVWDETKSGLRWTIQARQHDLTRYKDNTEDSVCLLKTEECSEWHYQLLFEESKKRNEQSRK